MRYFSVAAIALLVAGLASAGQCANQQVVQQVQHVQHAQTFIQPVIQTVQTVQAPAPVVAHVIVPQVQQFFVPAQVHHVAPVVIQQNVQVQPVKVERVEVRRVEKQIVQRQEQGNQVVQRGLINFNGGRGANVRQGGILNFSR